LYDALAPADPPMVPATDPASSVAGTLEVNRDDPGSGPTADARREQNREFAACRVPVPVLSHIAPFVRQAWHGRWRSVLV